MSDGLLVALVGAVALLLGSALGVIPTLIVTRLQISDARRAANIARQQHLEDVWRDERRIAHARLLGFLDPAPFDFQLRRWVREGSSTDDPEQEFSEKFVQHLEGFRAALTDVELLASSDAAALAHKAFTRWGTVLDETPGMDGPTTTQTEIQTFVDAMSKGLSALGADSGFNDAVRAYRAAARVDIGVDLALKPPAASLPR